MMARGNFLWHICLYVHLGVYICVSLAQTPEISHISLLLPFRSVQKVNATPGCFFWDSSNPSVVEVEPVEDSKCQRWPGSSREALLISMSSSALKEESKDAVDSLSQPSVCKIRVTPAASFDANEKQPDCGELSLEAYVSPIARLEILTTARKIGVDESEKVEVQAFDQQGNVFSTLDSVDFYWSTSPGASGPLSLSHARMEGYKGVESHFGTGDGISSKGAAIVITGIRSGKAELKVRLKGSDQTSGKLLEASVLINVVETLRLCPSAEYSPILLMPGAILQFSSMIDRSSIHFANKCPSDESNAIAVERHLEDVNNGKYRWREASSGTVGSITSDSGIFRAKEIGSTTVTFEESVFDENAVTANVKVVSPESVLLMITEENRLKTNYMNASGCPWVSVGRFPQYRFLPSMKEMKTEIESEWLLVLGRTYYIVATPFSEARNLALTNPGRFAMIVTKPMSFVFHDEGKIASTVDVSYWNLMKLQPLEVGVTYLNAELFLAEESALSSLKKKILITAPLSAQKDIVRFPHRHLFKVSFNGGSGEYSFSENECSKIVEISKNGVLTSQATDGRCLVHCVDKRDSSNFASATVVVSEPTSLHVVNKQTQYVLSVGGAHVIEIDALDTNGQPYDNCSDLASHIVFKQDNEFVDFELSDSEEACFAIRINGRRPGTVRLDLILHGNEKVQEHVSFLIYASLTIVEPRRMDTLSNSPMAIVALDCAARLVIEGGAPHTDVFSISVEKTTKPLPIEDSSAILLKKKGMVGTGSRREFEIICHEAGDYILTIQSGDSVTNMLIVCDFPTRSEIRLDGETERDIEGSLATSVPGNVPLSLVYYDAQNREFSDVACLHPQWSLNVSSDLARIESGKQHSVFSATTFRPTHEVVRVLAVVQCGAKTIQALRDIRLISFPIIEPAVHANILSDSDDFATFRIKSGSGNFQVYSENPNVLIEEKDRILTVRTRPGVVGQIKIYCKDLALNDDAHATVFAVVQVAAISQLTLRTSSRRAAVGDRIALMLEVMDNEGRRFSKSTYRLLSFNLKMTKEGVLGGVDGYSGVDDCLDLDVESEQTNQLSCFGVRYMNAMALEPGSVDVSAQVELAFSNRRVVAYSKVPVNIYVFEPLSVFPESAILLPDGQFNLRRVGGPRDSDGVSCEFESENTDIVHILNKKSGKIQGIKIGSTVVNCVCRDGSSIVAQAGSKVQVKIVSEVRIVGDKKIVQGGQTRFTLVGGDGETPLMFSSPSKAFHWSVDNANVVQVKKKEETLHTIWVHGVDVGESRLNVQFKLPHSKFYSSPLKASTTVSVIPKLKLVSPELVIMPPNSEVKIDTNLDKSSRIKYEILNSEHYTPGDLLLTNMGDSDDPCPCRDNPQRKGIAGVSISSSGILGVNDIERSFVVLVTYDDGEGPDSCCGIHQQEVAVHIHVRKVVSLGIEVDSPLLGVSQQMKCKVTLRDCTGFEFSQLHRGPKVQLFENIQGIVRIHPEIEPNSFVFVGIAPGFATIVATLSEYRGNFTPGDNDPVDFIDVTVSKDHVKVPISNVENPPIVNTEASAKAAIPSKEEHMELEEYGIVFVMAIFMFTVLWLLCVQISGSSTRRYENSRYTPYPYSGTRVQSLYRRQY